jgi:hypothetical protein
MTDPLNMEHEPAQPGDRMVRAPCDYPIIYDTGNCCGTTPCSMRWYRPCDAEGGCWDRSTCPGYETPLPTETLPELLQRLLLRHGVKLSHGVALAVAGDLEREGWRR